MTRSPADRPVRRAYKFIFWVAICYAIVTPIWWWLSPAYSVALCEAANVVFKLNLFSDDEMTYSYVDGKVTAEVIFLLTRLNDAYDLKIAARPSWDGRLHHFSFTIWAALVLATPFGNWRKKLLTFTVGWVLVFGSQLFALFVETLCEKSAFLRNAEMFQEYRLPATEDWLLTSGGLFFLMVGNKVLPIVLWLVMGFPALLRPSEKKKAAGNVTQISPA